MDDDHDENPAIAGTERGQRKLRAKVWNDRIKSIAAIGQGIALVLVGVGILRFALDPVAPDVGRGQVLLTFIGAVAMEALVLYILGKQRSED